MGTLKHSDRIRPSVPQSISRRVVMRTQCWKLVYTAADQVGSTVCVSTFMVGKDSTTAYERRRGRACKIPDACFGEWAVHLERYRTTG